MHPAQYQGLAAADSGTLSYWRAVWLICPSIYERVPYAKVGHVNHHECAPGARTCSIPYSMTLPLGVFLFALIAHVIVRIAEGRSEE